MGKKKANNKVRQCKDVGNFANYKKLYCSYNINDSPRFINHKPKPDDDEVDLYWYRKLGRK